MRNDLHVFRDRLLDAASAPTRERLACVEGLERILSEGISGARAKWPGVSISEDRFLDFLGGHLTPAVASDEGLRGLRLLDLYLACGCADGDPQAIAALERSVFPLLDGPLHRMGISGAQRDEVKQILREKMLVSTPPRIATFSGRSDLATWMRVAATRAAIDLLRSEARGLPAERSEEEELAQLVNPGADPEAQRMKEQHREAFVGAFREALRTLVDDDRLLLQQSYIDGMTAQSLGHLYNVHPTTISRRIEKAQRSLFDSTRQILMRENRLSEPDCNSLIRLAQSRLEITLSLLARPSEPPE